VRRKAEGGRSEGEKGRKGEEGGMKITRHQELDVYRKAFDAAMQIFEITKKFPANETYALTDQIRRSSRSVSANIAEAWRKRRYEAAFVAKLNDSEGESAETQTWLEFAVRCEYVKREEAGALYKTYDEIIAMLVSMIINSNKWVFPTGRRPIRK
jgi:four helix bundle protein